MRRCLNENVQAVMEELQGATVQGQQKVMPTPGGGKVKPGMAAQQVANGVQATANQAAGAAAAAGDANIQAQIAQQQGLDPAHAQQVNKTTAAQPQAPKVNPTALARDRRNDNMINRQQANGGKVVVPETDEVLDEPVVEDKVDGESAAEDGANPDDESNFNDDPAKARAAERAKEVFPGAKDNKAAGYGKDGAGRGQKHHEVTHPGQKVARTSEKDVKETVYSDAERTALLDEVFGA